MIFVAGVGFGGRGSLVVVRSARTGRAVALTRAMSHDAGVFRAAAEVQSLLALPGEVMGRRELAERIAEVANAHDVEPALLCPSRDEVLRLNARVGSAARALTPGHHAGRGVTLRAG